MDIRKYSVFIITASVMVILLKLFSDLSNQKEYIILKSDFSYTELRYLYN